MRHISLKCENHPNKRWSCKSIAVSDSGRYTGSRNVFYAGELRDGEWIVPEPPECDCPGEALIAVNMADVTAARARGA